MATDIARRRTPPQGQPRSSSCPTARFDSVPLLPHGPTLFFVVHEGGESAPATHVRASLATHACDSLAVLSSAATTTPLVDSRTPTSLRTPRRSVHRRCGRLGCLVVSPGSTSWTG